MIDFVEKGAGEVIFGLDADFGAVYELGLDFDFARTRNQTINFGNGEAALIIFKRFFGISLDNFGIN